MGRLCQSGGLIPTLLKHTSVGITYSTIVETDDERDSLRSSVTSSEMGSGGL
ncbi:hypothetical protein HISP_10651 [Haloarcula hispanica N601]|uniref:Uncharacterized protein n=2 Tax=Haloarcula hispanica TaxID=51589 RepID=W0GI25_HALHI|nr:hypothetical protein HAH_2093 [Haloarcula hispanica ATCC 33960]AHF55866.1 hypothetical protein HISP_10651 [Haloarcula hispanica N601]